MKEYFLQLKNMYRIKFVMFILLLLVILVSLGPGDVKSKLPFLFVVLVLGICSIIFMMFTSDEKLHRYFRVKDENLRRYFRDKKIYTK